MADVASGKAYLLTERVSPFLYRVWFLADVLDAVEELKLSSRKGFAGLIVNTSLKPRVLKYAGFEALVNKYVDIENILLELEEPYSTIILKRLFWRQTFLL